MSESGRLVDELRQALERLRDAAGQSRNKTVMGRRVGADASKLSHCLTKVDELLNQYFDEENEGADGETVVQVYPEIYDLRTPLAWNQLRINLGRTGLMSDAQVQALIEALETLYQQEGKDE